MRQKLFLEKVVNSLKEDSSVLSIFLKGSMGRNEHDEHSDVDLYCLVAEDEVESFLTRRLSHLKVYKDLIFYDDIFIISPQIIAIYEDWLHVDLYTVTEKTIQNKDFFTVLYDPKGLMKAYEMMQHLSISEEEFLDQVLDTAWFMFQYKKASERGNNSWAPEMLRHVMRNLSIILLYRYAPERAQLGLKTIHKHLPIDKQNKILEIYECLTPSLHDVAVIKIANLLKEEFSWIQFQLGDNKNVVPFLKTMINVFLQKEAF